MRICLLVGGSRGDFEPLLGLALGLRDAGHAIVWGGSATGGTAHIQQAIARNGFEDCQLLPDAAASIAVSSGQYDDVCEVLDRAAATIARRLPEYVNHCRTLMARVDALIGVGGSAWICAAAAAEAAGVPSYFLCMNPALLRSDLYPSHLQAHREDARLHDGSEGSRRINRIGWMGFDAMQEVAFRGTSDDARRAFGLPPAGSHSSPAAIAGRTIFAIDDLILPGPPDARVPYTQTSNLRLQAEPLSPELDAVFEDERPLFYFGFGSFGSREPARMQNMAARLAATLDIRALVADPTATTVSRHPDSKNVFMVGDVSHRSLFPRLAGVVHHGGAGTTANAAWAGVPQIIVPHQFDQFVYAHRIGQLGLGFNCGPSSAVDDDVLEAAGRCAMTGEVRERCRELGERLAGRDGVRTTVALLERWLAGDVKTGST